MADPHGRWRSFPGETPDTALESTQASGYGHRHTMSGQGLDESVRRKAMQVRSLLAYTVVPWVAERPY